ncbi:hypothetical protein [Olivibacter sitiensis]|uniref:hypothetical protein n=1 Tax=Olivibacter sitiensis TaxID=376470 RepID=UPI0004885C72|nr:hypothetical protein [Olivibacter sitiensis]
MKNIRKGLLLLVVGVWSGAWMEANAQGSDIYGPGLKVNIDSTGQKYVRFLIWNQIWARTGANNPGTMENDVPADNTWDIGARRLRFLAYAQISPRYLILTHFGINNQSFVSGGASGSTGTGGYGQGKKPGMFFHDVWNEYALIPDLNPLSGTQNKYTLYIGGGLHYWWGLSRMTSASTLNFLAIDAPIFNWPLIENSDQFARQFGIYAKGKLSKLWYQFNVNKPFATNAVPSAADVAVDHNTGKASYGGYVDWEFLEGESQLLPFRVGSYLGSKKVFNLGAGYYINSEGTQSVDAGGVTRQHDIKLFAVDAFADIPFGDPSNKMAVTAYSVFYDYDFGPNYLRNIGIMNTGVADPNFTGQRAMEGPGNARAMMGTGQIWYTQAGLVLPRFVPHSKTRLQPFAAYTYKKFEAHEQSGNFWDIGANLLLDGQNAKITAQYSSRPLFDQAGYRFDRKGEFVIQLQVYL